MTEPFSWDKPVRFTRVQNDDHLTYQPKVVGTYMTTGGGLPQKRWVVVSRSWDNAIAFIVYNENGKVVAEVGASATNASGIFDAQLVNGPEIKRVFEKTPGGTEVYVTYEGNVRKKVELVK